MPGSVYSSQREIQEIVKTIYNYVRLPYAGDCIPGALMEATLARVSGGERLNTYDFVDVIKPSSHVGWQVKSTKAGTPVTWKRAKIPNSLQLIAKSEASPAAVQALGDAIIDFCNKHAQASLLHYNLHEIGYSRLILHPNGTATYFERLLITRQNPVLFAPSDFSWRWSVPKKTKKKEQLPALHGTHRLTGKKWFAWHGRGENQLHLVVRGRGGRMPGSTARGSTFRPRRTA